MQPSPAKLALRSLYILGKSHTWLKGSSMSWQSQQDVGPLSSTQAHESSWLQAQHCSLLQEQKRSSNRGTSCSCWPGVWVQTLLNIPSISCFKCPYNDPWQLERVRQANAELNSIRLREVFTGSQYWSSSILWIFTFPPRIASTLKILVPGSWPNMFLINIWGFSKGKETLKLSRQGSFWQFLHLLILNIHLVPH